jgi:hypothetical protein
VHDAGIEVFDMRYIDEMGMRHAMELALALVDANTGTSVWMWTFWTPRMLPVWAPCRVVPVRRSCA